MDSSDARGYVVLGKLLVQQKRYDEARKLYADGTTATGERLAWLAVWLGQQGVCDSWVLFAVSVASTH
jgi:hypothetical protein